MKYLSMDCFWFCYSAVLKAPRRVLPLGVLTVPLALSGCVPALSYEEATSAAEVQAEARRRAELELAAERAKNRELAGQLKSRDKGLEAEHERLAQERYEHGLLAKERDETVSLVDQLRGDLSRANDNLKSYAADKARLEGELSKAKTEAPAASLAAMTQALQIAVTAAHLGELAQVRPGKDSVTLRVEASGLFSKDAASFRPEFAAVFEAAQRWLAEGRAVRGELKEGPEDASVPAALGHARRERLVRALEDKKLAERIAYRPAELGVNGPGSYELVLQPEAAASPPPGE